MSSNEKGPKVKYERDTPSINALEHGIPVSAMTRRVFLAGGTSVGGGLLLGRIAPAENFGGIDGPPLKEYDIATNGISLHVTEQGEGPAVLFCHGFPDTSYTWRRQMKAIASAGYRAIAPDMRGYGRSSAPADATLYTPLHTAGDLVGLLDSLKIPSAVVVGHDWGAAHAWNVALMRPDRFKAVLGISVPYVARGDISAFERMRKSGHQNDFYMFEQMKPEADRIWADASVTIPGILYWASGSAPVETRWNPMDPARSLYRPAPGPLPSWAEPDYVTHNIAEFQRTGFHGALNYYRAAEPYFYLSGAWKGAKLTQPSFYIAGTADGLGALYPPFDELRSGLPGLVGNLEIDNVGHWVQHEASAEVSDQLVKFLHSVGHILENRGWGNVLMATRREFLATTIPAAALLSGSGQSAVLSGLSTLDESGTKDTVPDYPTPGGQDMTDKAEDPRVTRARLSGPEQVTKNATVAEISADGTMIVLVKGTNEWVCTPGDENKIGRPPMCMNPMGMQWMMDAMQGKPRPTNTAPGMIYMLCGATQRSNTDPSDKTSPAILIGPHWMVTWPFDAAANGLPTTVRDKGAWVMFAGTPYAYLHVCGDPWEGNEYHQGDKAVWTMSYVRQ